jgi:hypothetical protein
MQFLYPAFLFGLLALAVPVIVHLFYFRRFKTIYFTNVKFLKELKQETSARQKLKNLLVLLMRCLAIAALVFAFAQPFIPTGSAVKQGLKSVSVFIDNSNSMSAMDKDISLFDKAKFRAREIIQGYKDEDKFQILTNDFEGKHQRLLSKEDALAAIDELKISPAVRNMSEIMKRQKQVLNTSDRTLKIAYVISDFQKNISDFSPKTDSLIDFNLIPLQAISEKNVAIDSCWFEIPVQMANQVNPLVVKVHNYSEEKVENVTLTLKYDGQEKPVGNLNIEAGTTVTDTINMSIQKTGWHQAELLITDYPVQFDDHYFFTFNVAEQIDVLCINEDATNRYLDAAFRGISYFKLSSVNSKSIDYSKLGNNKLIICNGLKSISTGLAQELFSYMKNGGNVLIFPPENADLISYNAYLNSINAHELGAFVKSERKVSKINTTDFVFSDVYENANANLKLPTTTGSYPINEFAGKAHVKLLSNRDGSTYLAKYKVEKGNQYLCFSPLDEQYNDLVSSAEIFIPMLYKMSISTTKSSKIAYTLDKDAFIESDVQSNSKTDQVYKLKNGNEEIIPEQKTLLSSLIMRVNNLIKQAGFYTLIDEQKKNLQDFAFNFNRKESDLVCLTNDELKSKISPNIKLMDINSETNLTAMVGEKDQGIILWKWFVVFALIFLALESLIIRFWESLMLN